MVGIRIGGGGFDPRPSRDGTAQLPNGCAGAQAHGCRASRQVTGVVAFVASLFFFAAAFDDEGPCPSYHISFCSPVFYPLIAPCPPWHCGLWAEVRAHQMEALPIVAADRRPPIRQAYR